MSASQMPRDYYDVLGVSRDADETEIKKALATIGAEPVIRGPDEMKALITHESADLGQVARQIGLAK